MADSTDHPAPIRTADLAAARDDFIAAARVVPDAALGYRPPGDDYTLGGLGIHLADIARTYARLLREFPGSGDPIRAPESDLGEDAVRRRLLADGPSADERSLVEAELHASHELFAAALGAIDDHDLGRRRPVLYGGSAEPFATAPLDLLSWVVEHDRAHVQHAVELLAGHYATANVALVDAFGRAWNEHDLEAALGMVADDSLFDDTAPPPDGRQWVGRDAVREAWQPIFDDPAAHFDVEETIAVGDRVVQRWSYSWADGHVRGVDVFRIRDGRIAEKRSYVKG